jgi:membrane protein implicated in regulation of membrane protease activity
VWWAVLLLIVEMFVMSFDALALSIAAFVTAWLSYMLWIESSEWQQSLFIFLVASGVTLVLVRMLVLPKLQWAEVTNPMSSDTIGGKVFTLQHVNNRDVIKYEGMYWNVSSDVALTPGEKVKVLDMEDNIVRVEKAV